MADRLSPDDHDDYEDEEIIMERVMILPAFIAASGL